MRLTGTGIDFEQFAIRRNLLLFPETIQFVAREKELSKIHELLYSNRNRIYIILYSLGGIGKTQLANKYIRQHEEKYTVIL